MSKLLPTLLTLLLAVIAMLPAAGAESDFADAGFPAEACTDMGALREWLAERPLDPVEGVWEYPADEVALLVIADPLRKGHKLVFVAEATDCRLWPGMKIGELEESADSRRFKITLCSHIADGLPAMPRTGLATLADSGNALYIEMPKLKLNFSPGLILPVLWNKLRINVRMRNSDPLDKLPEGWIRKYPEYDGNLDSSPRRPRYL